MTLSLHNLKAAPRKRRRRVGRGNASGRGTYSGRGLKGQRARTGGRSGLKQKSLRSLFQRLPKQAGFKSLKPKAAVVTFTVLERHFPGGGNVSLKALMAKGIIARTDKSVKIVNTGHLAHAYNIIGCKASAGARERIVATGGSVE